MEIDKQLDALRYPETALEGRDQHGQELEACKPRQQPTEVSQPAASNDAPAGGGGLGSMLLKVCAACW